MPKPNRKKLALSCAVIPAQLIAAIWVYPRTQIENPALNLLASAFWGAFVGAAAGIVLAAAYAAVIRLFAIYKEWLYG